MRKRARLCDSREEVYNADDFISRLPEEILASIVSRLTLKEAGTTSILSRRWRNLWKLVTGLDFSDNATLGKTALDSGSRNAARAKYINWVNRVIREHKGPSLDAFKIHFDLDKTSKSAIDNWVKFAISKNVKKLEVSLLKYENTMQTFPFQIFAGRQSNMGALTGLRFLRVLTLRCVKVSDQVLESLLINCPLLESISVHGSKDLVNVKVTGQYLKLNSLEIIICMGIKTVEIRDTNLASLSYWGPSRISFIFKNVPKLNEISIGCGLSGIENNVFRQLACCFNQLKSLSLVIYRPQENLNLSNIPQMPKLKDLILKMGAWNDESLLKFISLLKCSPNLERFVLQLKGVSPLNSRREMLEGEPFVHRSLKVVGICGYYGRVSDAEMVMYFIRNAPALRKIVIKTAVESAKIHAQQLLQLMVPSGVELVIY